MIHVINHNLTDYIFRETHLENCFSWLVTRRFCMTHEEPDLFTINCNFTTLQESLTCLFSLFRKKTFFIHDLWSSTFSARESFQRTPPPPSPVRPSTNEKSKQSSYRWGRIKTSSYPTPGYGPAETDSYKATSRGRTPTEKGQQGCLSINLKIFLKWFEGPALHARLEIFAPVRGANSERTLDLQSVISPENVLQLKLLLCIFWARTT